jgi:MoxR-like ATPase
MAAAMRKRRIELDVKKFQETFEGVVSNVKRVIKGKDDVIRLALVAMLCEGHVLFEDVPGVGKTMMARALAQSMNALAQRIQCTPDMLPGDITGSNIFDTRKGEFHFRPGPVFANVLLSDEINRATPKTQSALLEAMQERRVTVEGVSHDLPRPFLVLATQNPVELAGTFPLPEAQLDRFMFKLSVGYPDREAELQVVFENAVTLSVESLGPVIDTEFVNAMIAFAAGQVETSTAVGYYIVDLAQATRPEEALTLGASPRAPIALLRASRVLAASDGRSHVYPDDVRHVLRPVMAHRLMLAPDAMLRGDTVDQVLERVVAGVKPPLMTEIRSGSEGEKVVAERVKKRRRR